MNRLAEIVEWKRIEVDRLRKRKLPAPSGIVPPDFRESLRRAGFAIIAEVKRRSPSAGELDVERNPADIAAAYAASGAAAISVLTDEKFFGGSFELLTEIAAKVPIPVLCKDFVIDPVQIDLAKACGASAVLLIAEILSDAELHSLYDYAARQGLDALVEAHEPGNIRRVAGLGAAVAGINNRNLKTFDIDLEHSIRRIGLMRPDALKLSLSAVETPEDVKRLKDAGFDGALIGSSLMKSADPGATLAGFAAAAR